jgi:hypothetical protein
MPYRGSIPRASEKQRDVLPARIVGGAALGWVAIAVVPQFIPHPTFVEWKILTYWGPTAFRLILAAGAILFAIRTRDHTARVLAGVGLALLVVWFASLLWLTLVPADWVLDTTRPTWAPPKAIVRPAVHMATFTSAASFACLAWTLSRRDGRSLAFIATAFAAGIVFQDAIYVLERPWIQHFGPDKNAEKIAVHVQRLLSLAPACSLALEGLLPHQGGLVGALPCSDEEGLHDTSPYAAVAPVVAAVAAIVMPIGTLAIGNAVMVSVRGEHDVMNWMSGSGYVRLELFESLVSLVHGAALAGAVFVLLAARRARSRGLTLVTGSAGIAMAAFSAVMFLRGRWKLPIQPMFFFEHLQVGWAVAAVTVLVSAAFVAMHTWKHSRLAAVEERDDIQGTLVAALNVLRLSVTPAATSAAVAIILLAFGDESTSNHELMAAGGGLAGAVAIILAIAAVSTHARCRAVIAEAIRRAPSSC